MNNLPPPPPPVNTSSPVDEAASPYVSLSQEEKKKGLWDYLSDRRVIWAGVFVVVLVLVVVLSIVPGFMLLEYTIKKDEGKLNYMGGVTAVMCVVAGVVAVILAGKKTYDVMYKEKSE